MTAPQVRWISQHLQDSTPPWTIRRSLSLAQCSVPQASTAQLMLCNGRQSLKLSVQLYIQCRLALQCAKCLVMDMCNVQWTVYNVQHEMCNGTVHCVTQVGVEGNGRWLAPSLLVSGDTRFVLFCFVLFCFVNFVFLYFVFCILFGVIRWRWWPLPRWAW